MSTASEPTITRLARPQLPQAAQVLARAFHTDPMSTYMLPDESRREAALAAFFRATLRIAFWNGQVETTPGLEGVAVWLAPGKTDFTWPVILRSRLILLPIHFGGASYQRFMRTVESFDQDHQRVIGGRYWYLLHLGVAPGQQGQGIGSRLMGPGLAQADQAGLRCYLETLTEANVRLYQRHGFTIRSENAVQPDGPRFWTMVRDPQ
jgi:ribosomal protein S18 acetylase RimI-like enzyme